MLINSFELDAYVSFILWGPPCLQSCSSQLSLPDSEKREEKFITPS